MDWSCPVDKTLAAKKIRALLEGRVARLLDCKPEELPPMKIGSMAHFLFLLMGDSEVMPGFNTALSALVLLLGPELLWEEPKAREAETPKAVIN
jgi:hypothetical protein